ncbi:MAG: mechanosensitive ion channel family protein [Nitrospira sp.]|nr:mechanosensitive ion channel family protein [Nitrospira sp.]
MNRLKGSRPLMVIGSIVVMVATVTMAPVRADSETVQPTFKELMERKTKTNSAPEGAAAGIPDDSLGRGTPRSSVQGYLQAATERNYARAAEFLDLRNLPPGLTESQGPELARQLKIVLDRALWIDIETLSANPDGESNDNLPVVRERIGHLSAQEKSYDLLMQRVPRGDGVYIWKFSSLTVADIPELYQQFGYGPLEHVLPSWLFDVSILGVHLVVWAVAVVLGILLIPVARLAAWLLAALLGAVRADLAQQFTQYFRGPFALLVWTVIGREVIGMIGPSVAVRALGQARTVQVIALAWFLVRLIDFVGHRIGVNLDQQGLSGSRVLLTPVARLVKILALAGAVLLWLDNAGYKVTTLLAGLSISGVAVALASQKSLENIFGALTLFASRPVKVGDFCRFGDRVGTIEEIGLRATRVRTLERTVITVANAEFANMHLDNYSERDRFWYHPTLQLRYETTPDQIRYVLVEIRKMLYGHPKILSEPLHVRFKGFGVYSLDVDVFAYIGVTDYQESLEIAEDLNLRIMDIIEAAGSDFAVPAEVQYSLPGKPFDENRAKAVGAAVKEWRSKRELYLPGFPPDKIAALKNSLEYPPEGSPQYTPARV